MEEVLVIASSCDEDRPIERIDASRRTPYYYSHVGGIFDTFPVVSMCFTTSKFQALLQSSEFLTLASQVGSLDEGEVVLSGRLRSGCLAMNLCFFSSDLMLLVR